MKRTISILLVMLLIMTALAACDTTVSHQAPPPSQGGSSDTTAEKPTEAATEPQKGLDDSSTTDVENNAKLLVWAPDSVGELTKQLCDDFVAKYPDRNITVEIQYHGESEAATLLLNDPDASADVFGFPSDQLSRLYRANALSPVAEPDDVIGRNNSSSVDTAIIDGTLYAYPETADNGYYLVYDKSVVSDAQAKTLEGVLQACRAAGRKFVIDAGNGFFSCMFPFTGGLKTEGLDSDSVQQFNNYNEDEVVDTLKAFSDLFDTYSDVFMSSECARISSGMMSNPRTVGAGIDGNWNASTVKTALGSNYGVAKLPTINVNGADKQIISMHGYKYLGVNSHSAYPHAAQALADYLTGEDAQLARATGVGWGPTNTNAAADSSVAGDPALAAVLEQAAYSVPSADIADTFWTPMGTLGNALWKNGALDKPAIRTALQKCITDIKDE